MKIIYLLGIILCLNACNQNSNGEHDGADSFPNAKTQTKAEQRSVQYIDVIEKPDSSRSYDAVVAEIKSWRMDHHKDSIAPDVLSKKFTEIMVNKIFPYWYGTVWDFNGYTSVPNDGVVACGYFVSTTLLHAGININRFKLAQQSPINEAKTLALDNDIIEIVVENNEYDASIRQIADTLSPGLYFLGFNSGHVGFLLHNNDNIYLIHSNYMIGYVMMELINESVVFTSYQRFYIVPLSNNDKFLKAWLLEQIFEIVSS